MTPFMRETIKEMMKEDDECKKKMKTAVKWITKKRGIRPAAYMVLSDSVRTG